MIDFTYAKNKTYDFTGETITFNYSGGALVYTALTGAKTYLEHLTDLLAWTALGKIEMTMDTEFIKAETGYTSGFSSITATSLDMAYMFGLDSVAILGLTSDVYYFNSWGYKLPRTTVHELASLQGGFIVEKQIKDLYRQRETKVTKNKTYSTNFSVRMGMTYNYRLDKRYLDQFMTILAEWMDEEITCTSDWGIDDGTCISQDSGIRTLVYPDQEIYMVTITLLGASSGKN